MERCRTVHARGKQPREHPHQKTKKPVRAFPNAQTQKKKQQSRKARDRIHTLHVEAFTLPSFPLSFSPRTMFKKLTERFPAAAKGLESLTGTHATASGDVETQNSSRNQNDDGDQDTESESKEKGEEVAVAADGAAAAVAPKSDDRIAHVKAAIAEKINSESVSAAASIAASSMFGFMKKAQSVASVAAREGAAKATVWKNKALDAADMDALQRRLSYALDRSTGEVNLELLNFSYITDNIVAMGFPSMNSGTNRTLIKDNPIDLVSMYLNDKHGGHFMIWNLSGKFLLPLRVRVFCLLYTERLEFNLSCCYYFQFQRKRTIMRISTTRYRTSLAMATVHYYAFSDVVFAAIMTGAGI